MVLVTGASGFVGRNLVSAMVKKGIKVRAVSRRSSDLPCETVSVGEIDGLTDWAPALRGITEVVHLAASTRPAQAETQGARELYRINADGTACLARQAAQMGIRHFIHVSSIGAVTEESTSMINAHTPCRPQTEYGKSKLHGEEMLRWISEIGGLPYTIFRPPVVYGAGNPGNMGRLVRLVNLGLPLPFRSVRNRRSFIYVENLTDLLIASLSHPAAVGKTFFPSDAQDISTPELIEAIAKAKVRQDQQDGGTQPTTGLCKKLNHSWKNYYSKRPVFPFPPQALNLCALVPGMGLIRKLIKSLFVDCESVMNELNWVPGFTFREGVMRMMKKNRKISH